MSDEVSTAVRRFVSEHGGSATAVLQPVGYVGVRVTLVGADGVFGDQMVRSMPEAHSLVEHIEGLTEGQWDRELMASATPESGHAHRMAGWSGRGL